MAYYPQEFVNREAGIDAFEKLIQHRHQRVLLLHGPGGIGKSSLLGRLHQIGQAHPLTSVVLDLANPRLSRTENLIDEISEQLGQAFRSEMAQWEVKLQSDRSGVGNGRIRPLTNGDKGGGVSISGGEKVKIHGDVIGTQMNIQAKSITINNIGNEQEIISQAHRRWREGAFRLTLRDFLAREAAVFLIDHLTKERGQQATNEIKEWLHHTLLSWLISKPEDFVNLWLVVAGRQLPFAEDVDEWRYFAISQSVEPLLPEAIEEFVVRLRGLEDSHLTLFIKASGGNPGLMFLMANNLANAK